MLVWLWYVKLKRIVCVVFSVIFAVFSVIVLISELTLFITNDISVFGNLISVSNGFFEIEVRIMIKNFISDLYYRF